MSPNIFPAPRTILEGGIPLVTINAQENAQETALKRWWKDRSLSAEESSTHFGKWKWRACLPEGLFGGGLRSCPKWKVPDSIDIIYPDSKTFCPKLFQGFLEMCFDCYQLYCVPLDMLINQCPRSVAEWYYTAVIIFEDPA